MISSFFSCSGIFNRLHQAIRQQGVKLNADGQHQTAGIIYPDIPDPDFYKQQYYRGSR